MVYRFPPPFIKNTPFSGLGPFFNLAWHGFCLIYVLRCLGTDISFGYFPYLLCCLAYSYKLVGCGLPLSIVICELLVLFFFVLPALSVPFQASNPFFFFFFVFWLGCGLLPVHFFLLPCSLVLVHRVIFPLLEKYCRVSLFSVQTFPFTWSRPQYLVFFYAPTSVGAPCLSLLVFSFAPYLGTCRLLVPNPGL